MKRYFYYEDEEEYLYWIITIKDTEYEISYGQYGLLGQEKYESFSTTQECTFAINSLIEEKINDGYKEKQLYEILGFIDERGKGIKISLEYYDIEDILYCKDIESFKYLIITNWGEASESKGNQDIIDFLLKHCDILSKLESISIGDISQEECKLSWIRQGDYSNFWQAFPYLKHISIQGTQNLVLGDIVSLSLESICIISGGLPHSVIKSLTYAKTPYLKKMNIYLGMENYGIDANTEDIVDIVDITDITDIKELLEKSDFPYLEYLGICNTKLGTQIIQAVVNSKYAGQIQTFDISKSIFTDESAQILLDNIAVFKNLKELNLKYNYMSEDMCNKIKQLPFKVDVSNRQEYQTDKDTYCYNQT